MTIVSAADDRINQSAANQIYHLYPRRFAILIIFCLCSSSSGFQWIEYVIIQNIIIRYYNSSLPDAIESKNTAVAWTSLSYMVTMKKWRIALQLNVNLLGHLHSIDVSSDVAFRSLWNENHLLYGCFSQCHRCSHQMFQCTSRSMVDRLRWTSDLCLCSVLYSRSVSSIASTETRSILFRNSAISCGHLVQQW